MFKNPFKTNKIENWYEKGLISANKREYYEAIKYFDKALEMDSNRADILSSKALALYALEKYEKALY